MIRVLCASAILCLLWACTPQQQTYIDTPTGAAKLEEGIFLTADNALLPYRSWLPKKPRAVVVALHGMNDYSNAFTGVGEFFQARGIGLYAYDQRGFGKATVPGIWGNTHNLTQDLKQFTQAIAERHPGIPIYILGESMGGAVAITAAADPEFPQVKGVILSAPAVWGGGTMNFLYRGMLWSMAHTMPDYAMTGSDLKIVASDNRAMLLALGRDPLVIKATRVDAIYGLVNLMDAAYDAIPQVKANVLLLYGANDQVIPQDPIEIALARFSQPITFAFYPKGYHMLLRDLESEVVLTDILSWIEDSQKPLPSGFSKEIAPQ